MTDAAHPTTSHVPAAARQSTHASARPAAGAITVISSDLMLSVRLEAAAQQVGLTPEVISSPAALSQGLASRQPGLVVLDLADTAFPFPETYAAVREQAPGAKVVAFYPHVRAELGSMAIAAGCDIVMPRSRFLSNPSDALRAGLAGDSGGNR